MSRKSKNRAQSDQSSIFNVSLHAAQSVLITSEYVADIMVECVHLKPLDRVRDVVGAALRYVQRMNTRVP